MSMLAQRLVRPAQRQIAVRLMSEQATSTSAVDAVNSARKMHRRCGGAMMRYSPFGGLIFMGLGGGVAYSIYASSSRTSMQTQTIVDMESRLQALEQNNNVGNRIGSELSRIGSELSK